MQGLEPVTLHFQRSNHGATWIYSLYIERKTLLLFQILTHFQAIGFRIGYRNVELHTN